MIKEMEAVKPPGGGDEGVTFEKMIKQLSLKKHISLGLTVSLIHLSHSCVPMVTVELEQSIFSCTSV